MVTVTKNGPYAVTGSIELVDQPRGEGASAEHFTLCRRGGSKNKPFCDVYVVKPSWTDSILT